MTRHIMSYSYKKHIQITLLSAFVILSLTACSDDSHEERIELGEVPADIVAIVQNSLPGITLTRAEKRQKDHAIVYEMEGKLIDGKEYEMKISDTGTIIKIKLED
jgi:uncharacterized membrane protein YkoI